MAANADNWGLAFFTTSTADLATNTTLGTATRLVLTMPDPIPVPETGSRTFKSVVLRVSFNDRFTVNNEVTAVRLGIQLGGAAFADTDVTFTQANTADHIFDEWTLDCTAYFNANFGAGASQTCTCALAVATTIASNIGGNVTAFLEYTYAYDDTVGTTRARTVMAMIGSHSAALTAVEQEIGLDGIAPPSTGQIPNLSTYIEESGVTFTKHIAIVLESTNGSLSTVDLNPEIQIDATAVQLRGVVGQALSTVQVYRDVINWDPAVYSTSTTHTLKMRDTTTTTRFHNIGGIMWITYTYNKSTSTRMMNLACVPIEQSNDTTFSKSGGTTTNIALDEHVYFVKLDIQEPGTITMKQSGVQLRIANPAAGSNSFKVAAGSQADRTYTPITQLHELVVHHRCDNGWTLARGENRLQFKWYTVVSAGFVMISGGLAWICYSSDVPAGGTTVGNKPLSFFTCAYVNALWVRTADIAASGGGQAPISFAAPAWKLSSFFAEGHYRIAGGASAQILLKQNAGEYDGIGWVQSAESRLAAQELASQWVGFDYSPYVDAHWLATGKLKPQTAHRILMTTGNSFLLNLITRITLHNISFPVAGTVTVNGSAAASKPVDIYAHTAARLAPYFKGTGAIADSVSAVACAWPAHDIGDVALLLINTEPAEATSLSSAQGFVQIGSDIFNGTTGRLGVYWCRATSSAMVSPTIADSGDHQYAVILTFGGCDLTGNPWDVFATDTATTSTAVAVPGLTTTTDNALVVALVSTNDDRNASGWTNADLVLVNEVFDQFTTTGGDGGLKAATGVRVAPGVVGATAATLSVTSAQARMSIALRGVQRTSDERVTTTTTDGAGAFTCQVPDNTRSYFACYEDGSNVGRSTSGTPGVSTFNVTIGAAPTVTGDVIITATPAVSTTATTATFTFTSVYAAEYSLDGGAYAPATSPINLAGLSQASHTLTIRDIASPTHLQSFTWTVSAAAGGPFTFPVLSNVTTADLIRDRMLTCIEAITPTVLPNDRFRRYRNEGDGDFVDFVQDNPEGSLRRTQVRTMGTEGLPDISNCDVESRTQLFLVQIAYPNTGRAGAKQALDRDKAIDRDRDAIQLAIGQGAGRQNFSAPYPDAVCVGWEVTRVAGSPCDILEIDIKMRFYRQLSH